MYGLALIFIAAVYLALTGLLLYKVKPYWGKALVLIAAILIPNADDWYYRQQLADYCKNEAGFKVYQQVSKRKGVVLLDGMPDHEFTLKRTAIAYVEWPETNPNGHGVMVTTYWHIDRLPDGQISKPFQIGSYTAPYEIAHVRKDTGTFIEVIQTIKRRADSQIVAEFKTIFYYGSWYPTVAIGRTSLDAGCSRDGKVLSGRQWKQKESDALDSISGKYELLNKTFTAI